MSSRPRPTFPTWKRPPTHRANYRNRGVRWKYDKMMLKALRVLDEERCSQSISTTVVAQHLGLRQGSAVSGYFRGQRIPQARQLARLAEAVGMVVLLVIRCRAGRYANEPLSTEKSLNLFQLMSLLSGHGFAVSLKLYRKRE